PVGGRCRHCERGGTRYDHRSVPATCGTTGSVRDARQGKSRDGPAGRGRAGCTRTGDRTVSQHRLRNRGGEQRIRSCSDPAGAHRYRCCLHGHHDAARDERHGIGPPGALPIPGNQNRADLGLSACSLTTRTRGAERIHLRAQALPSGRSRPGAESVRVPPAARGHGTGRCSARAMRTACHGGEP
ncbi:conserved hypothetical protein, partial [Ricinus communis]